MERRALQQRARRRAWLIFGLFVLSLLGGWKYAGMAQSQSLNPGAVPAAAMTEGELPGRINILLLGTDKRPGEESARADTIMLLTIDRNSRQAGLISVPRDTRVTIPGHGPDKINTAHALGGQELTRQLTGELLGLDIPYYVETDFKGFAAIIDALGGVELEVERRMLYPEEGIDLKPGSQRLSGENALAFVRFRGYPSGDIGRTEHQRTFLSALARQLLQPRTALLLPQLLPQVYRYVSTNLVLTQGLELASWMAQCSADSLTTATVPGHFLDLPGASYWVVEPAEARSLAASIIKP